MRTSGAGEIVAAWQYWSMEGREVAVGFFRGGRVVAYGGVAAGEAATLGGQQPGKQLIWGGDSRGFCFLGDVSAGEAPGLVDGYGA